MLSKSCRQGKAADATGVRSTKARTTSSGSEPLVSRQSDLHEIIFKMVSGQRPKLRSIFTWQRRIKRDCKMPLNGKKTSFLWRKTDLSAKKTLFFVFEGGDAFIPEGRPILARGFTSLEGFIERVFPGQRRLKTASSGPRRNHVWRRIEAQTPRSLIPYAAGNLGRTG